MAHCSAKPLWLFILTFGLKGDEMGRIKTKDVKRAGKRLMELYEGNFGLEFEFNKQFLSKLNIGVSKKVRNKIAGYITRQMRIREREEE